MLCSLSHRASTKLGDEDVRFLGILAQVVAEEVETERAQLREVRQRRARIEAATAGRGLSMAFQPIVQLRTMETAGVEALARFEDAARTPDTWFADATEVGLGLEVSTMGSTARTYGIETFMSLPLLGPTGEIVGTLCALSRAKRPLATASSPRCSFSPASSPPTPSALLTPRGNGFPIAYALVATGEWRSLVALLLWGQAVGGSNPPSPTATV